MFVFRGERLKEEGYISEERKVHNKELEYSVAYLMKKLTETKTAEEKLIKDTDGKMEKYKIFTKPINELTDQEKEAIISQYETIQQTFGGKVGRKTYSDIEIDFMRGLIKPMTNPLKKVSHDIEFYTTKLQEIKDAHKNNFTIALNRNEITRENIDAIIKHIEKSKGKGVNVRVCIDNAKGKKNNETVDYVFTKEDMELLIELDTYLKDNGLPGLSITEFKEIKDLDDLKDSWTLKQVIDANNRIDDIAKYVTYHNLSPFEAMTYIHKWASGFVYNGGVSIQDGRVLPSTLTTDKIVCSGYASMVKAVVDKLNIPGLSCEIKGCYIVIDGEAEGHCHNIVTINDPKYGINGTYMEDACWDCRLKGEENQRGFAHCLYPVGDLMNFNENTRYFSLDKNDRFSNLIFDAEEIKRHMKAIDAGWLGKIWWNITRNIQYKKIIPSLVEKYGECGAPISLEKYEQALRVVYATKYDDPEIIEKYVKRDIEKSKTMAIDTFNEKSDNAFSKGLSKKERKAINAEAKGPKTRL